MPNVPAGMAPATNRYVSCIYYYRLLRDSRPRSTTNTTLGTAYLMSPRVAHDQLMLAGGRRRFLFRDQPAGNGQPDTRSRSPHAMQIFLDASAACQAGVSQTAGNEQPLLSSQPSPTSCYLPSTHRAHHSLNTRGPLWTWWARKRGGGVLLLDLCCKIGNIPLSRDPQKRINHIRECSC